MAIPPFPAEELAKLVLGYLAEEQLMTAYDEFLHSSPYLDAHRNEYHRICMYPLRKILAEYSAVRIYVEACRPISLRKKLIQCTNLLEIVKYLVCHIDVNQIQTNGSRERVSFESQDVTTSKIGNESCSCLRSGGCICAHRTKNVSLSKSFNTEPIDAVETTISAQATSVSDLPGHQDPPENKHIKGLEHQNQTTLISGQNYEMSAASATAAETACNTNAEQSSIIANFQMHPNPHSIMSSSTDKINAQASMECSQNIAEFNTVLNQVYNNSIVTGNLCDNNMVPAESVNNCRISTAGTFQDFTTGVGGVRKTNINIPDSSTSESINVRLPLQEKENNPLNRNVKALQRKKCVFRVGNVQHDVTEVSSEIIDVDSENIPSALKPDEQKVTILSDVRVGNDDRMLRLAPVLKHATSTPLLQMQTILINGTPVYKPKPPEQKYTFTRDEIMAMPTIILVPSSGASQTAPSILPQLSQSSSVDTSTCTLTSSIQPLTVDVSNSLTNMPIIHTQSDVQNNDSKPGLVKTVEALKNASVPKDCIVASSSSSSTPHMLPPKRKSSSTPRRTSHVRVLDFTTPRRILNEAINENPNLEGEPDDPEEIILSKSTNFSIEHDSISCNPDPVVAIQTTDASVINLTEKNVSSQKKPEVCKKRNWDADLRALAVASESVDKFVSTPKPKPRPKPAKKVEEKKEVKKNNCEIASVNKTKNKTAKSKIPQNSKSSKKKEKSTHTENKLEHNVPSPDFPSIACTSVKEKPVSVLKEPEKVQNTSNDEECIDTPEVERLSLHNEIGVKLNISDILETPYKQALYDIQMETPRFLGPDLPDDPMSDIKIMNIPTPRFLSSNMSYTPKPTQATPSSYSSRPTDYSSGGSYYKPDDQDYLPILEDVVCAVTSTHPKENPKKTSKDSSNLKETQPKEKSKRNRSSRPVRQCTKNVSYYKSPMINNTDANKKDDASSCSDTISANSSFDLSGADGSATPQVDKTKKCLKPAIKKTLSLNKHRSPLKKVTQKSFMKIKPRRPTPTKKDTGKKTKKKPSPKDKSVTVSSIVVPVHTKSRRKSSTPRKLHCTKTFNSESSGHDSPEVEAKKDTEKEVTNDSDTEQLPLRWSDDGSQDMKLQERKAVSNTTDVDEISQIREYIDKTTTYSVKNDNFNVQIDLIKRGFDVETAKIIERDLLNTPSREEKSPTLQESTNKNINNKVLERSVESDCSTLTNNLVINEEGDDDDEEVEFSVHECNEGTSNYLVVQHDDTKELPECNISKLKDKFSMEICIDDGVVVRLRATEYCSLYDHDPLESSSFNISSKETEMAVSSICNMDRLYTPMKDSIRDQYYKIFDSTLTSIDTPLKADSPKKKQDCTIPEIILDVDEIDKIKEKSEVRKRKRSHGSSALEESVSDSKKVKPETQFILNSKNIQNLDIESVLSKLHGP